MATILWCRDATKIGCTWSGERDDLVAVDDDPDFDSCPHCNGKDFDHEEEEDEDEGE